ncbi:MAG: hypothetical protein O3A47_09570 [Chloroflexi bacterium]|nr:hypothetical protein [Chloroflexota bacterium]
MSSPDGSERRLAAKAARANALGLGFLWGLALLPWAGAFDRSLLLGFLVGTLTGVIGGAIQALVRTNAQVLEAATRRSRFGGVAVLVAFAGLTFWLLS